MSKVDHGDLDVQALRRRVRASQHTRSMPLIILGVLLVNYGSTSFQPSPVAWRFGAPLAFVGVWAALRANENRTGVGAGRGDYLVAAGFVFTATNLVLVRPFSSLISNPYRVQGIWVLIVGIAFLAIAVAARDWPLTVAALGVGAAGIAVIIEGPVWVGDLFFNVPTSPAQPWGDVLVAGVGAAMVVVGIGAYRIERSAS